MNKLNSLCIFYDADFPTQPGGAQKRLFELGLLGKEKYNEVGGASKHSARPGLSNARPLMSVRHTHRKNGIGDFDLLA